MHMTQAVPPAPPAPTQKRSKLSGVAFGLALGGILFTALPGLFIIGGPLLLAAIIIGIVALFRPGRKGFAIAAVVISAIGGLLGIIGTVLLLTLALGATGDAPPAEPAQPRQVVGPTAAEDHEWEPLTVAVPALTGGTIAEARVALSAVGLVFENVTPGAGEDWTVTRVSPQTEAPEGGAVQVESTKPEPVLTLSQRNAIAQGKSYLRYSGFSRTSLIGQLEYEGYYVEDATFAVDTIAPDWNAEAAETAKSYMEYSAFSRDGLYEQLEYEGFEPGQIEAGLAAVGY